MPGRAMFKRGPLVALEGASAAIEEMAGDLRSDTFEEAIVEHKELEGEAARCATG